MSKKNVAELLVETLLRAGVERIYGVPGDSLNGITDSIRRQEQPRWIHLRHEETAALAKILNQSKKITILGGAGCAGAHAELIELAGKLNAPIVHALRGKEFIEHDKPLDVGMTGLLG